MESIPHKIGIFLDATSYDKKTCKKIINKLSIQYNVDFNQTQINLFGKKEIALNGININSKVFKKSQDLYADFIKQLINFTEKYDSKASEIIVITKNEELIKNLNSINIGTKVSIMTKKSTAKKLRNTIVTPMSIVSLKDVMQNHNNIETESNGRKRKRNNNMKKTSQFMDFLIRFIFCSKHIDIEQEETPNPTINKIVKRRSDCLEIIVEPNEIDNKAVIKTDNSTNIIGQFKPFTAITLLSYLFIFNRFETFLPKFIAKYFFHQLRNVHTQLNRYGFFQPGWFLVNILRKDFERLTLNEQAKSGYSNMSANEKTELNNRITANNLIVDKMKNKSSKKICHGIEKEAKLGPKLSQLMAKRQKILGVRGMWNLGNTCYMNSAIQCLSNINIFRSNVFGDESNLDKTKSKILFYAISSLINELWNGQKRPVQPRHFKNTVSIVNNMYYGNEQHDCSEFLRFILSKLHDETNFHSNVKIDDLSNDGDFEKYLKNYKLENLSFISTQFYGFRQMSLKCENNHTLFNNISPFSCLDLPKLKFIPNLSVNKKYFKFDSYSYNNETNFQKSSNEIYQGLHMLIQERTSENNLYCKICAIKCNTISKHDILIFPKVLFLKVKNLYEDSLFRLNTEFNKNFESATILPRQLILKQFQTYDLTSSDPYIYDLNAVIYHSGGHNCGHYWTVAKNRDNEKWFEFNDSSVNEIYSSTDLIIRNAYILAFLKRDL